MINVNQITSKLAMMPDGALKQFAEMHKEDPYSFSLAIAESNRRKQIRSQAPPMQEQPKVADQEISSMTRPPEEVGIGALPVDMNMASGGIIAFDQGGYVPSYSGKKGSTVDDPAPSFDRALDMEGIDDPQQRAFLKAIYSQESSSGKNTKTSNRGAQGGMQILPSTFDSVADKGMDIKDPLDNMRAGIRYASQGYAKANGDPVLAGAYYYGGPNGMKKAAEGVAVSDPKNPKAPTTIDYGKSIADKMTAFLPISSAQAETVQPPVSSDVDRSIPGQAKRIGQGLAGIYNRVTGSSEPQAAPQQAAPERVVDGYVVDERGIPLRKAGEASAAPVARDDRSIFERGADYVGISPDFQRNFSTNLNALGGGFGGASRVFKAAPSGAKALEEAVKATPEAVAAAAAAAQKVANVRLAKPAAQGIETLTPEAQALRAAAENAKMARNLKADKDAAALAQKSVDSANLASKSVGEAARLVDATKAAQVNKVNKVVNAARVNSGVNAALGQDGAAPEDTAAQKAATDKSNASMQAIQEAEDADILATRRAAMKAEDLSKTEKKDVIALAKENAPSSAKTKGFNNDDWLQFGLSLMAGTSRYALQNVGTAGMAALAGKKEREKEERAIAAKMMDKTDMTKVIERLMKDDPKLTYREAYEIFQQGKTNADLIARGLDIKGQDATSRAVKVYQQAKEAIDSSIIGITGRSATATPAQKKAYADALAALGKNPAETVTAAPAAATMPLPGAKIVGSRPA